MAWRWVPPLGGGRAPGETPGVQFFLVCFTSPVEPRLSEGAPVLLAERPGAGIAARLRALCATGVGLAVLLSQGRAAGFDWQGRGGGDGLAGTAAAALYVGLTWSLSINHIMSIAQLLVTDFGFVPGPAFRWPYILSDTPHDFWGKRLDLAVHTEREEADLPGDGDLLGHLLPGELAR